MRLMTTIIQRSDVQNKSKTKILKHFEKTQIVKVRLLRPGTVSTNVAVYANRFVPIKGRSVKNTIGQK